MTDLKELRSKMREEIAKLEGVHGGTIFIGPREAAAMLDHIDRLEKALDRIAKPCEGMSGCDCLNGAKCAEIAREALK